MPYIKEFIDEVKRVYPNSSETKEKLYKKWCNGSVYKENKNENIA